MNRTSGQFDPRPAGRDADGGRVAASRSRLLQRAAGWAVSLAIHLCLFAVMGLFVMVVRAAPDAVETESADAFLTPVAGLRLVASEAATAAETAIRRQGRKSTLPQVAANIDPPPALGGSVLRPDARCEPSAAGFALAAAGAERPGGGFFGAADTDAACIVYVVDRSASMIDAFDELRRQMLISISRLREDQSFLVIMFAKDEPLVMPPGRLVPATRENKVAAGRFLAELGPEGGTAALGALKRAVELLRDVDTPGGKCIYLLTDGAFEGPGAAGGRYALADGTALTGNAAVVAYLRDGNADGRISVNTFLYGYWSPEAEQVMKLIADRNAGRFRFISLED